jgi:hypothetical protein
VWESTTGRQFAATHDGLISGVLAAGQSVGAGALARRLAAQSSKHEEGTGAGR